ncbi:Calcium release-activated calcium channel protein 1-like isoform X3 [Oopsacas minuta]|uniref:Calcium release-activated calcium channel protein 1-like isoform X3 n=1 Tax=Oopsacas minuta TaxID=111878 RepID=A0AAV7JKB1_9METZ|nr:Calcium release-activated calcium channel protein 1-like isoform X3 [Oopsacas minuta]
MSFNPQAMRENSFESGNMLGFRQYSLNNEVRFDSNIRATPELLSLWTELKLAKSKLQTSAKISSLMAGFAMVAMIEIQYNVENTPIVLLVAFCIVTTILIFSHLISLAISSSILPTLDTISETYVPEIIYHSPHRKLNFFIQMSWFISNLWGNFLMVILVTLVLWIKFARYETTNVTHSIDNVIAPIIGTSIVIPILILLIIVSFYIYATMHKHKLSTQRNDIKELEGQVKSLKITAHQLGSI